MIVKKSLSMLPTRYKPPTRCKLSLTRCKLLVRTYKVHLVGDNLHLVACPRNHESLSSGPKAPIPHTHQLCRNGSDVTKCILSLTECILALTRSNLHLCVSQKNAHCQRMHLGSVGFPNNLQFEF